MLFNWLTEVEKWLVIGQFCSWLFFFSQYQVFYILNFVFFLFLVFVI